MGNFRWIGQENDTITLKKFKNEIVLHTNEDKKDILKIAMLDVETSGLNSRKDEIIELGYVLYTVSKITGHILTIEKVFNELNQPSKPISEKIIKITGISNDELLNKKINVVDVKTDLKSVDLIISFNAKFDRRFVDRLIGDNNLRWACAYDLIPWDQYFPVKKLENLSYYHGFFYDAHRSINDAWATIHLLTFDMPDKSISYMKYIIDNYQYDTYLVIAKKTSFDKKIYFNEWEYRWDDNLKIWFKIFKTEEESLAEMNKMAELIYPKDVAIFNGKVIKINPSNRYKELDALDDELSLNSAKYNKPLVVIADQTDIDKKDILKNRGYEWSKPREFWWVYASLEEKDAEIEWLRENVYPNKIFGGKIVSNKYYKGKKNE